MFATFQVRSVFGNNLAYPMDENAQALTDLAGKKTFQHHELGIIKKIGIEIKWIGQTL